MKYYFSLLLFAFLGLVSSQNDTFPLDIAQVSGLLHERQDKQDAILIFPQTNINPSSIKHIIIKQEGSPNVYPLNLVCNSTKELHPYSFVKCQIDLSTVPKGFYKVILLIYGTEHYKINNLIPFLILGEEQPERPLELIDVNENIREFSRNQSINFLFSKNEINSQLIKTMAISINKYEEYNISLYCPYNYSRNMTWISCYGDFSRIKENTYKINRIYYSNNIIYPSRDLYIRVNKKQEEDLKLLDIRGYAYQGYSTLNLTFNKEVSRFWFDYFYLYYRTNYYNLTRFVINQYGNNSVISVNFDFTNISAGPYHLGTGYQGKNYNFSNLYINITSYNYTSYKWSLSNILYRFIGGKSKEKYNLRMPKK